MMEKTTSNAVSKVSLLSSGELFAINKIICAQVEQITMVPLDNIAHYHRSHGALHHLMANKSARQFSESGVDEFLSLASVKLLREGMPHFSIGKSADERGIQERPEVYFRLVRPHAPSDVGIPHCDHWFHVQAGFPYSMGSTYKLWTSISSEPGLNGLCFFPNANVELLRSLFFEGSRDYRSVTQFSGDPVLPDVAPGDALLFRDDVIHGGAVNSGSTTRCSIEVTFVPR